MESDGASGAVRESGDAITRRPAGARTAGSALRCVSRGTCAEREVLGEARADRRLDRAAEDGEERAARRVRPARAAIEPGVDRRRARTRARAGRGTRAATRRNTAISSNGTPARASSRIRRAISTHSRPSPGAEKSRTSPAPARSGGCRVAKRERRSAARSESPDGTSVVVEIVGAERLEIRRAWRDRRTGP